MPDSAPIAVHGLRKQYDGLEAVKGIDFEVAAGEVFGLLGPNGAGKTTTVEILEGLRPRSARRRLGARLRSRDSKNQLKDRIGVCLQATNLPDKIRLEEAVDLFSAFYTRTVGAEQLLSRLQLWDKRQQFYGTLSGGQKQRLAIALALINDPLLLFLDEPTTGLDPQVRLEIRQLIEELRAEKRTILLTTHYIEEAEKLCDRVAIIDEGRIVALGSPRELQDKYVGQSTIEVRCGRELDRNTLPEWPDATKTTLGEDRRMLSITSPRPARTLVELVKWIDQQGIELEDIHLKRPTLEDVFIGLTGKRLRE